MLTAVPTHRLSWSYGVHDGFEPLARIELAWLRETGTFALDGRSYTIARRGFVGGTFEMHCGEELIASARPVGSFGVRTFEIDSGREYYSLKPTGFLSRAYQLKKGTESIGVIRPMSFMSRKVVADLPETMPKPLQLFQLWLVLVSWKRQSM